MKFVYRTFAVTLIIIAVFFALSNRESIDIRFWPLFELAVPTYVVVLGVFAGGFLSGGFWFWLRVLTVKAKETATGRRADRLKGQLESLNAEGDVSNAAAIADKYVVPAATSVKPLQ